jgi:hypothetical protein
VLSVTNVTIHTPWCMSDHYVRFNDECAHMCYWLHYLHDVVYQITMSDLMMNVNTSLHIALLSQCWMSDHYIRYNDECTNHSSLSLT